MFKKRRLGVVRIRKKKESVLHNTVLDFASKIRTKSVKKKSSISFI